MKEREALKLALEALELCNGAETVEGVVIYTDKEISAIKEALMSFQDGAHPEQEPVAWGMPSAGEGHIVDVITPEEHARVEGGYTIPLYTTPPQPKAEQCIEITNIPSWTKKITVDIEKHEWVGLTDDRVEELIDSLFHFDGTRWSTDTPRAVIQEIIKECE